MNQIIDIIFFILLYYKVTFLTHFVNLKEHNRATEFIDFKLYLGFSCSFITTKPDAKILSRTLWLSFHISSKFKYSHFSPQLDAVKYVFLSSVLIPVIVIQWYLKFFFSILSLTLWFIKIATGFSASSDFIINSFASL